MVRFVLAAALVLLSAAPARAATVSLVGSDDPTSYESGYRVVVQAAPGEVNHVTFTVSRDGRTATVRDTGTDPTPGFGCTSTDASTVACESTPAHPFGIAEVDLGDRADTAAAFLPTAAGWEDLIVRGGAGDDAIDMRGTGLVDVPRGGPAPAVATGDAGDDVLRGGPRGSALKGGSGDDRLIGWKGQDSIEGGSGNDRIAGGAGTDTIAPGSGFDVVDGGTGHDGASYLDHQHGVHVDLRHDREAGFHERDVLKRVEDVSGTVHHDVLKGDGGPNFISTSDSAFGEHGAGDTIVTYGGADTIWDFAHASRIWAGAGNDVLSGLGPGDRANCGSGRDHVKESRKGVKLSSCEVVDTLFAPSP